MYSRAHILIQREFENLQKDSPWGLEVDPLVEDNVFEWVVRMKGLKDTIWEGGILMLHLQFDEHFNARPPDVYFYTIPFHPNVDMITGKPCLSILDDSSEWNQSYSVASILLSIQSLLSYPVIEGAVNTKAVEMFVHFPHTYQQIILNCIIASQKIDSSYPYSESEVMLTPCVSDQKLIEFTPPESSAPRTLKVSFDDYHLLWSNIATSKVTPKSLNSYVEKIKNNSELLSVHLGLSPRAELEKGRQKDLLATLMYGNFKRKDEDAKRVNRNLEQLQKKKQMYLSRKIFSGNTIKHANSLQMVADPPDPEVDDLVAWTTNLNEEVLDI